jgi:hypothetical protein
MLSHKAKSKRSTQRALYYQELLDQKLKEKETLYAKVWKDANS